MLAEERRAKEGKSEGEVHGVNTGVNTEDEVEYTRRADGGTRGS